MRLLFNGRGSASRSACWSSGACCFPSHGNQPGWPPIPPIEHCLAIGPCSAELDLSKEQQATIDKILVEMENEIQTRLKAALAENPNAKDAAESIEAKIADEAIAKHGQRLMAVLNKEQANRFWQIGAAAQAPPHSTTIECGAVLKLTDEQQQKMLELSEKMVEQVNRLALNVEMPVQEVQEKADLAQKDYMRAVLASLTERQRQDFDQLMGKPFNQELLKNSDGTKRRSLTFVFGLSGKNQWALATFPETRRQLALSDKQDQQIQALAGQATAT